jgi:hypothetical protein
MSEIQRYSLAIAAVYDTDVDMVKDDFGAYVEYRDHASRIKHLEQELAEAKKLVEELSHRAPTTVGLGQAPSTKED